MLRFRWEDEINMYFKIKRCQFEEFDLIKYYIEYPDSINHRVNAIRYPAA